MTMLPTLDTPCGALFRDQVGLAGLLDDRETHSTQSFYNAGTTGGVDGMGTIAAGFAVAQGTADNHVRPITADDDVVAGIACWLREHPMPMVPPTRMALLARLGPVLAVPCEDVRARDQVVAIVAKGGQLAGTKGGPVGPGRLLVPGAIWRTDGRAGEVGRINVCGT
jgi:hypothetical protein